MAAARNITSPRRSFLSLLGLAAGAVGAGEAKAAILAPSDDALVEIWRRRDQARDAYLAAEQAFKYASRTAGLQGAALQTVEDAIWPPLEAMREAQRQFLATRARTPKGVEFKLQVAVEDLRCTNHLVAPIYPDVMQSAIKDLTQLTGLG